MSVVQSTQPDFIQVNKGWLLCIFFFGFSTNFLNLINLMSTFVGSLLLTQLRLSLFLLSLAKLNIIQKLIYYLFFKYYNYLVFFMGVFHMGFGLGCILELVKCDLHNHGGLCRFSSRGRTEFSLQLVDMVIYFETVSLYVNILNRRCPITIILLNY